MADRLAVVEHAAAEAAVHPGEPGVAEIGGGDLQRRKLDRRVEAVAPRIGLVEGMDRGQMQPRQAFPLGEPPPPVRGGRRVGEQPRAVDGQERLSLDGDVARVAQGRQQVSQKPLVAFGRVPLFEEHLAVEAVPGPRPVLVGPTEAERKVRAAARQQSLHRLLEDPPAVEPIVVEAEAVDAVPAGQFGLPLEHGLVGQVVVADVGMRHARLLVAGEHRPGPPDVGPLGESLAPPGVVLGNAVELGQVHRDRPHVAAVGRAGQHRGRGRARRRDAGSVGGRKRRPGIRSSRLVFGDQEVHERIDVDGERPGPGGHVGRQGEARRRLPPLPPAGAEKVRQRLEAGQRDIRVPVEVPGGIEQRMRRAAFPPADREVVRQGLEPGRRHVGVRRHVSGGIERGMRRAALPPADREVVQQGLAARRRHVGVSCAVPRRVEQRMRLAALAPAVNGVVSERVEPGGPHVGVTREIPGRVEQRARGVTLPPAAAAVVGPRTPADAAAAGTVAGGIPARVEVGTQVRGLRVRHASRSLVEGRAAN